jgi:hypothetical protein
MASHDSGKAERPGCWTEDLITSFLECWPILFIILIQQDASILFYE